MTIKGTRGDDNYNGTSGNDTFQMGQGGNDTVHAGDGNDLLLFGAAFTAQDTVDGGTGTDTLVLGGDYTGAHAVTMLATTLTNVETISLTSGDSYNLTTNDANVAAGEQLAVNAATLGAADSLTFDGSAETDGHFRITGGAGNDTLTGGAGNDTFVLSGGGDDIAHGGGGNDVFQMGAALSPGDQIDGGTGSDTVELNGDYSGAHAVTLLGTTLANVETLVLAAGHSYDLTTADGNVATGQVLTVNGAALGAGDSLTFNGAAETDGRFAIAGGAGDDVLTGSAQNDTFNLTHGGNDTAHGGGGNDVFNMGAAFTAADSIDGGTGTDILNLSGDYSAGVTFGATTLTNVENIVLAAGHSYSLITNDATVANGAGLIVNAAALGAGDSLTFDGSAETDGSFSIVGGAGNDVLTGGAKNDTFNLTHGGNDTAHGGDGNDTFNLGAAFTAADTIDGGTGTDTLNLNGDYSAGVTFGATTLTNVENIVLAAGHSYGFTTDDATVAAGQTLTVDGSALGAGDNLLFDGSAELDGSFHVLAGLGSNTLIGGAEGDTFDAAQGTISRISGNGGDDIINIGGNVDLATTIIDGGTGNDTLNVTPNASSLAFSDSSDTGIETINLNGGFAYTTSITGNIADAGKTLTIDAGAATTLSLDLTGATSTAYAVTGLGGDDTILFAGNLHSGDAIDGGAGNDTVELNGDYSAGLTFGATTLTNVENIVLDAGHSYFLSSADGTVASGHTLTVDASALSGSDVVNFDGSAETDGNFAFIAGNSSGGFTGGAGDDTYDLTRIGSSVASFNALDNGGSNTFTFAGNYDASRMSVGGAGHDTVVLDGDYSGLNFNNMSGVTDLVFDNGHSYSGVTFSLNDDVSGGQQLTLDASALDSTHSISVDFSNLTNSSVTAIGGAGDDTFTTVGLTPLANDQFNGGSGGNDTLVLAGNVLGFTFGADALTNIDTIQLTPQAPNDEWDLTTNNANVAAGATLTVDATALGAAAILNFDGSAETNGYFHIEGGAGQDNIVLGSPSVLGGSTIDGGAGNDSLTLNGDYSAGFTFGATTMTNVETLTLDAGHSYNLTTNNATVAAGQTLTVDGSALGSSDVLTFNGAAETDGSFAITGGAGNDVLTGGTHGDTFDLSHGGNDAVHGGGGNDTFNMGAAFTAADSIDGGTAVNDTLSLDGDYSGGVTFDASTLTNVEKIVVAAGHSYDLATNDATVGPGQTLTVDGSALGGGDVLTFDGSAETDGSFAITGGAGNDVLTGGAHADTFDLTHGGNDTVHGGDGNDTFNLGAAFTAADSIDGGVGTDTLNLNGDYSAAVTFGATTLTNVEDIVLAAGNSYNLTTNDATVAAGQTLTVDGSALGSGDAFTFNGSAETDGAFHFIAGAGDNDFQGGGGNDLFDLTQGQAFSVHGNGGDDTFDVGANLANDSFINGGTGNNTLNIAGAYGGTVVLVGGTNSYSNIETVQFGAGHSYTAEVFGDVTGTSTLTVDSSALGSGDSLTFNGSAVSGSSLDFLAGAGNDTLTGSAQNDTFEMGAHLTAADTLDGGDGVDTLILNGDYSAGLTFGANTIANIENITLAAGHIYNLTTNDANVGSGQTLTVDGSALGVGFGFTFNGAAETDGFFAITGGGGNDALTGGSQADTFDLSHGGNDTAHGGGGNDTFNLGAALTAADTIDGGAGINTIELNGDYSAGLTFGATTMTNVEDLTLAGGHSYNLTVNAANFVGVPMFTVDATALGTSDTLTFNGSTDTTAGGGLTFNVGAHFTAADSISGAPNSSNLLQLAGDYSGAHALTFGATTISGIEFINLGTGFNYNLTTNDANVAAGQTLFVNASALGAGNSLTFNGSAETDGSFAITGGAGDDVLTGGAGNDSFYLNLGGNDTVHGGGGNDTFNLFNAFTAADSIDGGSGTDTLNLGGDYSAGLTFGATTLTNVENIVLAAAGFGYNLTTNDATVAANQTLTVNGSALGGSGSFLTFDGSAETDGSFSITGGTGNDVLTGGAQADTFDLTHGGNDTAHGGGGNDTLNLGAAFTAADNIDGGAGTDTLNLNGDYASGVTFGASTLTNVENIVVAAGHSYNLTTDDATVASGQSLTIGGSALGAGDVLTFDGSAESDGSFDLSGGAGNDTLKGGAQADTFDLSHGGNDTAQGGGGNDTFNLGAAFTAADSIDGGAGSDTLNLNGDYSAGITLGATTLTNVEDIVLAAGNSYNLTTNDATVAAGQTLTVNGSALGAGDAFTFNGAAETDGGFIFIGGAGTDTLTGGAGNDLFSMGGHLTASDALNGGTGFDEVILNGDYSAGLTFTATTVTNIDTILLDAGNSYNLTTDDGTVAAGQTLAVDGSSLGAGDAFTFNGAAESDGSLRILGGAGTDTLTGGAQNDTFDMGANLTTADAINGGAGTDTLDLNGDYSAGFTFGATTLTNVEDITLGAGHSYNLTTNDATVASGQTLTVDGSALGASDTLTFNALAETDGKFAITGGAGDDTFTFGAKTVLGNSTIDGGGGNDTLILNGNFGSPGVTFGANSIHNIEKIVLENSGFSYTLTTNDANVAAGQTLTVDATAVGSHSVLFNAQAEKDGFLNYEGNPTGNDVIELSSEAVLAGSTIDGGSTPLADNNTLVLDGDFSTPFTFGNSTMTNIFDLSLSGAFSYNLTTVDDNVAAGALLEVSAGLSSGHTLTFNGSAETDGRFEFFGGTGADTLIGGAGNDIFDSAGGADTLTGNGGADEFAYGAVSESTSVNYDHITDINFSQDTIHISYFHSPTFGGVDAAITTGALSTATFDSDLAAAVNSSNLEAFHAALFTPDSGTLSGHAFLVVDQNGTAGYQASADIVIDVTGYTGTLTNSTFV